MLLSGHMFDLIHHMAMNHFHKTKWIKKIYSLFVQLGKPYIFNTKVQIPPKVMHAEAVKVLKDQFIARWYTYMDNHSKCDLYSLFKPVFGRVKYLSMLPPKLAITLCKYRCSNHKLEVETMRYARPFVPRHNRKCTKCNLSEVGNEIHHLLVCPRFSDLRVKYIPTKFTRHVGVNKFLNLISCNNYGTLIQLALFIRQTLREY